MMSKELEMAGTAVYAAVCAVVWEDGGRKPASCPILCPNTLCLHRRRGVGQIVAIGLVYLDHLFDYADWRSCYDRQVFEVARFFRYAIQIYLPDALLRREAGAGDLKKLNLTNISPAAYFEWRDCVT